VQGYFEIGCAPSGLSRGIDKNPNYVWKERFLTSLAGDAEGRIFAEEEKALEVRSRLML